jgi:imidazolonepropionase-like amidohydrolase
MIADRVCYVSAMSAILLAAIVTITNVTVIDANGVRAGQNVTISGDRIERVGSTAAPAGARIVDGTGRFLIPGLWDMHVHFINTTELAAPLFLANGVTTVRDLGGDLAQIDFISNKITNGELAGPRILRAGPVLDGPKVDAPARLTVTTPEEGREAVRMLKARGVDCIKTHNAITSDVLAAVAAEARKNGLQVAAHLPATITAVDAARAGVASIEHVVSLVEHDMREAIRQGATEPEAAIAVTSDAAMAIVDAQLKKYGVWVDPTLVAYDMLARRAEIAADPGPLSAYVAQSTKIIWERYFPFGRSGEAVVIEGRKRAFDAFIRRVSHLRTAGVAVLTGTDSGLRDVIPGFSLHDELRMLVRAGFTPAEALNAATADAARFSGIRDGGKIDAGQIADAVLLDANPLDDIGNTRTIRAVIARGKLYDRAALDRLLEDVKRVAPAR